MAGRSLPPKLHVSFTISTPFPGELFTTFALAIAFALPTPIPGTDFDAMSDEAVDGFRMRAVLVLVAGVVAPVAALNGNSFCRLNLGVHACQCVGPKKNGAHVVESDILLKDEGTQGVIAGKTGED